VPEVLVGQQKFQKLFGIHLVLDSLAVTNM